MRHTRTTIQRSAAPRQGKKVTGCAEAQMITLTGRPANQRGFGIQRSDAEPVTRVTRTRRSDAPALARIDFPEGYDADKANETLKGFGLSGYSVEEVEGRFTAFRADLKSTSKLDNCDAIKLTGDGIVAHIQRSDEVAPVPGKHNIAIASIEFNTDTFSRMDAEAWLQQNGIDFSEKALDNSSGNFVLQRKDVEEGEEQRQIELESGVVANVIRADLQDIPAEFVVVISEAAYSGWGWGQLDFAACIADSAVGDLLRDGLYVLRDVLENIMFHSALPLDSRKELVSRALTQYGAYANNLFDQLPRQLLVSVANVERKDKQEEPVMSKENQAKSEVVTRADVESILDEKLNSFFDKITNAKRSEEQSTAEQTPADDTAAGDKSGEDKPEEKPADQPTEKTPTDTTGGEGGEQSGNLTRSDMESALEKVLKPFAERLEKMESTTILRSDAGDAEVQQKVKVERSDPKDPFKGALFGGH